MHFHLQKGYDQVKNATVKGLALLTVGADE